MLKERIAFIGAGNMAEAFCRGLLSKKLVSADQVLASDPRPELAWTSQQGIRLCSSNLEAAKFGNVIILAVKPGQVVPVLIEVFSSLSREELEKKLFISIAAGVRLASLEIENLLKSGMARMELQGAKPPFVRVMPNTPALVGLAASAYCRGKYANAGHGLIVKQILEALGLAVEVAEEQMDAVTALSGSGPAYVFLFMEALQESGLEMGLSEAASFDLACQTLKGAAEMISKKEASPSELRRRVTSPNGTTAAALQVFESEGFKALVKKALFAARDRSIELGKPSSVPR